MVIVRDYTLYALRTRTTHIVLTATIVISLVTFGDGVATTTEADAGVHRAGVGVQTVFEISDLYPAHIMLH